MYFTASSTKWGALSGNPFISLEFERRRGLIHLEVVAAAPNRPRSPEVDGTHRQ